MCCGDISKIENYDRAISDYKKIWHCHHKKETPKQGVGFTKKELIKENLYFNRPPEELIFLTPKKTQKGSCPICRKVKNKNNLSDKNKRNSEFCGFSKQEKRNPTKIQCVDC